MNEYLVFDFIHLAIQYSFFKIGDLLSLADNRNFIDI